MEKQTLLGSTNLDEAVTPGFLTGLRALWAAMAASCFALIAVGWKLAPPVEGAGPEGMDPFVPSVVYGIMISYLLVMSLVVGPFSRLRVRVALRRGEIESGEGGAETESYQMLQVLVRSHFILKYALTEGMAVLALVALFLIPQAHRGMDNPWYAASYGAMAAAGTLILTMAPSFSRIQDLAQHWREDA